MMTEGPESHDRRGTGDRTLSEPRNIRGEVRLMFRLYVDALNLRVDGGFSGSLGLVRGDSKQIMVDREEFRIGTAVA